MSGKRFTLEQVLETTRAVVEQAGMDHVYEVPGDGGACVYAAPDGSPSCLVGQVINRLDPEVFANLKRAERSSFMGLEAHRLRSMGWIPQNFWDDDTDAAMQAAQACQDEGKSWGDALYAAENLGADAE